MKFVRWVRVTATALVIVIVASPAPAVHGTSASFNSWLAPYSGSMHGGSFTPSIAPIVTQTPQGQNIRLKWSVVTFSKSLTVTYEVVRIEANGTRVAVCIGANAPVLMNGTMMSCIDQRPPAGSTYSERPMLTIGGQTTWSLTPSTPN